MKCESQMCTRNATLHKYDVFVCDEHKESLWAIKKLRFKTSEEPKKPVKLRPYNGRY